MAIIKCKMCGGDLEILKESTVCECAYCGTRQIVPSEDKKRNRPDQGFFNPHRALCRKAQKRDQSPSCRNRRGVEIPWSGIKQNGVVFFVGKQ